MKVCVVGTGYIGLPTALMLASHGHEVEAVGHRQSTVERLNRGELSFKEEGLSELFERARDSGSISFRSDYPRGELYIVTVPTPYLESCKKIDLTKLLDALEHIFEVCSDGAIVIIESTISPGTVDTHIRPLIRKLDKTVHLVHAPERIIPGNMIAELYENPRTIGADEPEIAERVRGLYASFCRGDIELTDIKTAEMSKVVENSFRDVSIAFANELAKICNAGGMDVREVIRIANKHPRVNILQPGPGVGGHCISVDPWFLVGDFPKEAQLIKTAREINSSMPEYVLQKILQIMADNGIDSLSQVGLYGLTYKENVDDTRESPTLQLLDAIRERGLDSPAVFDPLVDKMITERQFSDLESFVRELRLVVIMAAHNRLYDDMKSFGDRLIFDTRDACHIPGAYKL